MTLTSNGGYAMGKDSNVNPGKGTQNTRVQRNDAVSKRIAAQDKPDRSTVPEIVSRISKKD